MVARKVIPDSRLHVSDMTGAANGKARQKMRHFVWLDSRLGEAVRYAITAKCRGWRNKFFTLDAS